MNDALPLILELSTAYELAASQSFSVRAYPCFTDLGTPKSMKTHKSGVRKFAMHKATVIEL